MPPAKRPCAIASPESFRTAITDQGSGKATAKGMIDLSSQRLLQEYRQQPALAGPLVLSLADLYGALEDVEGAGNLLEGFLAENSAGADPAVLADARQKLANIELLRGHTARCAELLDQAQAFWDSAPKQYAEERLEGLGTRAKLQRSQGNLDQAILTSRTAIEQRTGMSGRNDRETATLYNSLAITLTTANRLEEALASYRETLDIYQAIGLGDGLDAQIIRANLGWLESASGTSARPAHSCAARSSTSARWRNCGRWRSDGLLRACPVDSRSVRPSGRGVTRGGDSRRPIRGREQPASSSRTGCFWVTLRSVPEISRALG